MKLQHESEIQTAFFKPPFGVKNYNSLNQTQYGEMLQFE